MIICQTPSGNAKRSHPLFISKNRLISNYFAYDWGNNQSLLI